MLPFSLLISGNIIAEIKNEMKKAGADAFPVIMLEGKPGCGKTSIAKATLFYKEGNLNFTDSRREIKKRFQQHSDRMILIDDFPDNKSHTLREKNMSILEESVRESYRGEGPVMLVTIETGAVSRLTKSCKERMLFVSGEMVLADKEKQDILYYLQENPDELRKTLEKFHTWYGVHDKNFEFMQKLRAFREENSHMDFRSASLLFQYKSAMNLFLDFLKMQFGVDISEKFVTDNIMALWKSQKVRNMDEGGAVKMLFEQMIGKNILDIYEPEAWNLCEHYCKDNCPANGGICQSMDEECYYLKEGYFYDPEQLMLVNQKSAVLVRYPEKICGFPQYGCKKPFLIADAESITEIGRAHV